MSEHENAPAAPPEGAITRWGYDYVNQGDQLVERDDGGYVLYADHAAALAAATARAEQAERLYEEAKAIVAQSELAERLAQAEAERLRRQNNDLMAKLGRMCGDA